MYLCRRLFILNSYMQPKLINKDFINALAMGDHGVFRKVFGLYFPKVHAFALGLIKNESDAEDVSQTVFIKLWTNRTKLLQVENLDSYIFTITRNTVLNQIAQRKAFNVDLSNNLEATVNGTSPLELIEAKDLKLLIDMVVEQMPPQRQAVYRMSREEGLTNDQIAEQLGIQKKTVENHLNLALGELRKMLKILIFAILGWGHEVF